MRRFRIATIGSSLLFLFGCLHAPVLWSPDGQWLAYTLTIRADRPGLEPGWLFETVPRGWSGRWELPHNQAFTIKTPLTAPPRGMTPLTYRLWATRAATGESVLLEESLGPLTSPSWSPAGQALAFGRLVPENEGRARFEIVIQEAPDRQRIVLARPVNEFQARAGDLPGLAVAWSPDARYLAIPMLTQALSLGIIRADNGRILKVIPGAYLPSWSPDGTKLAFVQGGDPESLHCVDHNFGPSRQLADIGQTSQAPVWSRDSRSLAILARRMPPFQRREPPSQQVDLLRVHVESGKTDVITTLLSEPGDRDRMYNGSSFSLDRDGNELFYVSDVEGQLSEITWYRPRTGETAEKFHPIDPSVRIGALAVAPNGKTLALRAGATGDLSTPALLDLETKQFTPLIPDDSARLEWLSTLVTTAQVLLRTHLPTHDAQNRVIDRPSLLPVIGELPSNPDISGRLRKLGRIGRPICERPEGATPASPAVLDTLAEARLFFDFLREDYPAALASIDALETRLSTREQRLRLLGVRAQVFLAQKQFEQSGKTIAFLQAIDSRPGLRIEQTPGGPTLTEESGAIRGWPSYLTERCQQMLKASADAVRENPLGHRNPDNPNPHLNLNPNADFVPAPGGAPLPFAPMIQFVLPFMPLLPGFEPRAADINRLFPPPQPPLPMIRQRSQRP